MNGSITTYDWRCNMTEEELKWEVDETRVAYEEARDFYIEMMDAKDEAYLIYVLAKGRLDKYQEHQQQLEKNR